MDGSTWPLMLLELMNRGGIIVLPLGVKSGRKVDE